MISFKVKLSLYPHEDVWEIGGIAPFMLTFDNRRRIAVNLTAWPLYSRGTSPLYSLIRGLFGFQGRSERFAEKGNVSSVTQPVV